MLQVCFLLSILIQTMKDIDKLEIPQKQKCFIFYFFIFLNLGISERVLGKKLRLFLIGNGAEIGPRCAENPLLFHGHYRKAEISLQVPVSKLSLMSIHI